MKDIIGFPGYVITKVCLGKRKSTAGYIFNFISL